MHHINAHVYTGALARQHRSHIDPICPRLFYNKIVRFMLYNKIQVLQQSVHVPFWLPR